MLSSFISEFTNDVMAQRFEPKDFLRLRKISREGFEWRGHLDVFKDENGVVVV